MNNLFLFHGDITARAYHKADNRSVKLMWHSFCSNSGELNISPINEYCFIIGEPNIPTLPYGKEFIIHIDENGAVVIGRDYNCLIRGYLCLLMKIDSIGNMLSLPLLTQVSDYRIVNRMIHICVFPENDLLFIKKLIRLSALCQYTHIVIEFWGMLRFNCLKELSWPHAFSKNQACELIDECRELGIEPIPMFNQLGHATASRLLSGKHVVLDQNPNLKHLFTPDGWAWNITSDEVPKLLKSVRTELYDLFGPGEYIHLGCDEAYYISRNSDLRKQLPDYLHKLTLEVESEGRRPLIWMDMLLEKDKFDNCYCVGEPSECEKLRNSVAKSTIFTDWQYDCIETPIPSLTSLKSCEHDTIGAPWFNPENYTAHINTVEENNMFGIMMTTWHLLKDKMYSILGCAKAYGAHTFNWSQCDIKDSDVSALWSHVSALWSETATLLRFISFEGNTYESSGWTKRQIEV